MFTITVRGKTHTVEKVTPRALYEMGPALDMFVKIQTATQKALKGEPAESGPEDIKQAMDVLIGWFVIFCGNRFTREDILDGYGADSIMTDIGVALTAVQTGVTEALTAFPTTARPQANTAGPETATPAGAASLWKSMRTAWKKGFRRR
jgi:hypothetical protein